LIAPTRSIDSDNSIVFDERERERMRDLNNKTDKQERERERVLLSRDSVNIIIRGKDEREE
jgi:hypothetical protein